MKETDFQNLLQGIREAGSYLRGNKRAASHAERINPTPATAPTRGKQRKTLST
jgi:hypothetical protein